MKYLILGSAGQIGRPLCNFLKELGHDVLTFDIVDNHDEDLRIPNNKKLDQYVNDCDFVFFLAWDVGGSRYLNKNQDSFDFIQNNIKLVSNAFDAIKKHNKPFLFASSQMANMGFSSYGVTKNIGERIAASLNGITVKFWNVYGPETNHEKFHAITDFILKAKNTKVIDMLTDGKEVRQFLHATDCSKCLYALSLKYKELPRDKEYHVTSFEWTSIIDVANIVSSNFPGTVVVPSRAFDAVQMGTKNEADNFILNYWKPEITLEDGIKHIINFMENSNDSNR
jgi:nucleoside-diphosphate-sugar epimerase